MELKWGLFLIVLGGTTLFCQTTAELEAFCGSFTAQDVCEKDDKKEKGCRWNTGLCQFACQNFDFLADTGYKKQACEKCEKSEVCKWITEPALQGNVCEWENEPPRMSCEPKVS